MDIMGIGTVTGFAREIVDRIWPKQASEAEKLAAVTTLLPLIEQRDDAIIETQKEIIVAEMQQGDLFTKRARPSVVYCGLVFIGLVHVIFPIVINLVMVFQVGSLNDAQIAKLSELTQLSLPGEFWMAWGAVVSIWSIGRTLERRGMTSKMLDMITGGKTS